MNRKKNRPILFHAADPVSDRILHNGLQYHAGHLHIQYPLVYGFFKLYVPCKSHIQYVDIIFSRSRLIPYRGILQSFLYIIAEKFRHLIQENAGFFRVLHHGQLGPRIEGIKQKMGIYLGLQVFKAGFLQVVFHQELPLQKLLLLLSPLLYLSHIFLQASYHLVEGPGDNANLVVGIRIRHLYIKVPLSHQIGGPGQTGKGRYHILYQHPEHHKPCQHDNHQDYHVEHLHVAKGLPHGLVAGRVVFKLQLIEFRYTRVDVLIEGKGPLICLPVPLHVPPPLGLHRILGHIQIGFRHHADVLFQDFSRLVNGLIVQAF